MTDQSNVTSMRLDLDSFLAGLPADKAAQLRVQAERIDALERHALPVRGVEQKLWRPFLVSLAMFATGLVLFLASGRHLNVVRQLIGEIGLCILLGALPGLAIYYTYRVRWRTKADMAAFNVNRDHFLPHGVIYFSAPEPGGAPSIVPVDAAKAYKPRPTKNDKLKPGWIW